jgi:hypothetical protein
MTTLNLWKATWSLDEAQCPCDIHFLEYLEAKAAKDRVIFHFGTGNHHILGLKTATNGSNNAVLGITASRHEYDAYIDLLVSNPHLGHTYKAYFGDIYQLDRRQLPVFDIVTLYHVGEFRSEKNDEYGALTDLEMTRVLCDRLKTGGILQFYAGSYAFDVAERVIADLTKARVIAEAGSFKTLRLFKKLAT